MTNLHTHPVHRRAAAPLGEHLGSWRQRRRLSQLDLALEADISTRHLSFVETGRAEPSREMVLKAYEPYPALALDRHYKLVTTNRVVPLFLEGIAADMLQAPINVVRLRA